MIDPGLRDYFFGLAPQGSTLSPDQLTALGPQLQSRGISLAPNAAGVNGKIKLPSGEVIDVIQGAGSGLNRSQWLEPGPSHGAVNPAMLGALMAHHQASPTPYDDQRPDRMKDLQTSAMSPYRANSQQSPFTQIPQGQQAALPAAGQSIQTAVQPQRAMAPAPAGPAGNQAMQQALGGGPPAQPQDIGFNPRLGQQAVQDLLRRKRMQTMQGGQPSQMTPGINQLSLPQTQAY